MSSSERRIAPRKIFSIPIRIRPLASESLSVAAGSTILKNAATSSYSAAPASPASSLMNSAVSTSKPVRVLDMQEGETVNLSERGIYFKTAQKVRIGQAMETLFHATARIDGAKSGAGAMQRARGACRTILGRAGMDGSGRVGGTVRTVAAISNLGQLNLPVSFSGCATACSSGRSLRR